MPTRIVAQPEMCHPLHNSAPCSQLCCNSLANFVFESQVFAARMSSSPSSCPALGPLGSYIRSSALLCRVRLLKNICAGHDQHNFATLARSHAPICLRRIR